VVIQRRVGHDIHFTLDSANAGCVGCSVKLATVHYKLAEIDRTETVRGFEPNFRSGGWGDAAGAPNAVAIHRDLVARENSVSEANRAAQTRSYNNLIRAVGFRERRNRSRVAVIPTIRRIPVETGGLNNRCPAEIKGDVLRRTEGHDRQG